jgi:hypothetical protein
MIRCQSCHEFVELQLDLFLPIAEIAHTYTCLVCGANDATSNTDIEDYDFPAFVLMETDNNRLINARRSTDTGTFLAGKTVKGNTSEIESSGPLPPPEPFNQYFKTSVIIVLISLFYLLIALPLILFSEIHGFFKVFLFLISVPSALYARFKAEVLQDQLNRVKRVKV